MSNPIGVAICIDDFGFNAGINDAALRLAAARRVSAISCMVQAPAWPEGAARLLDAAPDADIGLHLNLTEALGAGAPGASLAGMIARSHLGLLDRGAIRASVRSQLDGFEDRMGRVPDFVDGHQHVHQLPVIRDELVGELARRPSGRRPWLRVSASTGGGFGKSMVIDRLGAAAMRALASRHGLRTNASLLGVYGFDADAAGYARHLQAWLRAAAPRDLLMCHPAAGDASGDAADPIAAARRVEFEVLSGDGFEPMLALANVRVDRLSRLLDGA